jgi:hypothetical protein
VLSGPRGVSATLGLLQAGLCALAILGWQLGGTAVAWIGFAVFVAGVSAIIVLDGRRWRPAGIAVADEARRQGGPATESLGADSG